LDGMGWWVAVDQKALPMLSGVSWGFTLERVTGIEPALSAWESEPSGHLHGLACEASCPLVTVKDLPSLRLMAR